MDQSKCESKDSINCSSTNTIESYNSSRILQCLTYDIETTEAATSTTTLGANTTKTWDITTLQPYVEFDVVKSIFAPLTPLLYGLKCESYNLMQFCCKRRTSMRSLQLPRNDFLCYVVEDTTTKTKKKCFCRSKTSDNKCILFKNINPDENVHSESIGNLPTIPKCPCVDNLDVPAQHFPKQVGPTISSLELAIQTVQGKCQAKDLIIEMMTAELASKQKKEEGTFESMMAKIVQGDCPVPDYSIEMLEQEELDDSCECTTAGSKVDECLCNVSSEPLRIVALQKLTQNTFLLKWVRAADSSVIAYEIYLNGALVHLVSGELDCAVFSFAGTDEKLRISLYAVTKEGRCYPEAIALAS